MVIVQGSIQDFRRLICRALKRGKLRKTIQLPNPRASRMPLMRILTPAAAAKKPNSFSQSHPLNTYSKTTSSTPKSRQPPYSALTWKSFTDSLGGMGALAMHELKQPRPRAPKFQSPKSAKLEHDFYSNSILQPYVTSPSSPM